MLRWTIHILTLLSLLLMLLSCVAWVLSLFDGGYISKSTSDGGFSIVCVDGDYEYYIIELRPVAIGNSTMLSEWKIGLSTGRDVGDHIIEHASHHTRLGLFERHAVWPEDKDYAYRRLSLTIVPIWFITLLLAILPAWWLLPSLPPATRHRDGTQDQRRSYRMNPPGKTHIRGHPLNGVSVRDRLYPHFPKSPISKSVFTFPFQFHRVKDRFINFLWKIHFRTYF